MTNNVDLSTQANKNNQDWVTVIAAIAAGEQSALNQFYKDTSHMVFGLILRILGNRNHAEEVLLEVYTQVWRQACRYDVSRGTPLGWLLTIARSRAIDRLRLERHTPPQDELDERLILSTDIQANPEHLAALAELQVQVRAALDLLPPEQRGVIELSYYFGYTQKEIAAHLGQPLGTIKTRTRLALTKLKEALKPIMEL